MLGGYLGQLWLGNYGVGGTAPESPPGDLEAVLDGTVTLTWTDTVSDNTGYAIQRSADGGAYAEIDTVGADEETYEDTDSLTPGVIYTYRLEVTGGALDGQFSNTDSVGESGTVYPFNVSRHRRRLVNSG